MKADTVAAVLERLGVAPPSRDLAGLQAVYAAWCRGVSFDNVLKIGDGRITYGQFLTDVLNLAIIGAVVFLMVKAYQNFQKTKGPDAPPPDIQLLTEIRDALKARQ